MRLLAVGDIHLGRQPTRLPERVREQFDARALGPAAAWERTVTQAIEQGVAGVLLAGDVVDDDNDFYEAYADLRAGVVRLREHGIEVIAVVGNHDVHVLPELADALSDTGFRLLGQGGQWESARIASGSEAVSVVGWSFPAPTVATSPLDHPLPQAGGERVIGLLHGDRDQPTSPHAPLRSAALEAAPVDAWLLGHIHKPDALSGARPMGYLGSLGGLDPGEPGPHGPWLVTVGPDGVEAEQLPLAPLRWETVDVPLDELASADAVLSAITQALQDLHRRIGGATHTPRAVGCRLRLTGRTAYREAISTRLASDDPRGLAHEADGIVYFVESWRLEALPAVDLATLATGSDPVGLLAHKVLVLRGEDSAERRQLIAGARQRLAAEVGKPPFDKLGAEPPDDETTRELLERAALRGLDALLAQGEEAD